MSACVDDNTVTSTDSVDESTMMNDIDMHVSHNHMDQMLTIDHNTHTSTTDMLLDMSTDLEVDAMPPLMDLGPPLPRLDPEYVMNQIQLLDSSNGFDLNDDGVADNGLALLFEDPFVGGALGGDPNEYIARTVRRGKLLLLLDFAHFNDFVDDDHVQIDIFLGRDADDRRANNFDGTEFFVSCSSLTNDGMAESRFETARIVNQKLQGDQGQFRFLISFGNTEVLLQNAKIEGVFADEGQRLAEGMLGGAVSFEDLERVVRNDPEIGDSFAQVMLNFLEARLDIDLDADERPDALSASFIFTAVPAIIKRDDPCME